jgi:hypothetical protein
VRIQRRAGDAEQLHTGVPVKTAEVLRAIVETEGPVHADEASRVLASLFGTRVSPRSTEAFERALAVLTASGPVVRRGEFLWLSSMTAPAVRDRSGACPVKDPDLVAPEEFEAAALLALVRQYGIPREALAEAALRAMGFSRTTPRLLEAAGAAVERLVAAGRVVAAPGGHLAVQSP